MTRSTSLLLTAFALLLVQTATFAQRLNIGYASGTGGVNAVYVGYFAGY